VREKCAGNADAGIMAGFTGIGKSKSSHFGSDKFLATSKYELSEQSCALLFCPILFDAALQSRRRHTDDNDSTELEKPQLVN